MSEAFYLLTGATGLLGGNILKQLLENHQRVRILALPNDAAISNIPGSVEIIQGDLLDDGSLDSFFAVPENTEVTVIHAAGIVTMDPKPNKIVYAVNVDGTKKIIDCCLRYKVKKLVYISSTGAIPEPPIGQPVRETEKHDPDMVIGYYSKTKAIATELVMQAAKRDGLDASIIYPSGILGPNDPGSGMITSCIKMVAEGRLRIAIGGTFNYVDARDLASGTIACAEKGRKGETYIMSSRCYSFTEFICAVCEEAGVKKPLFTVPLWIVRPFSGIGALYGKLTGRPAWFSRFTVYNLERNNNFSAAKSEEALGFKCRSLNETVADTIEWLKHEGRISCNDQ